jgi:accessory gene regulator B
LIDVIALISLKMAQGIKRQVPDHPTSVKGLKYSISNFLNIFTVAALSLLISTFTGNTKEIAIILIAFGVLRQASGGGMHFESSTTCALVTTLVFTLLSYIHLSSTLVVILNIISLALVMIYAPNFKEQHNKPPRYFTLRKIFSAVLVLSNFFILSPALTTSFLVQSITLPMGKEVKTR